MRHAVHLALSVIACILFAPHASAQCQPRWSSEFVGGDLFAHDLNQGANAMAVWERDGVRRLCFGGTFTHAGGLPATAFACLGPDGWADPQLEKHDIRILEVTCLAAFDDGQGARSQIYVGGSMVRLGNPTEQFGVIRWDGETWQVVGNGLRSGDINDFAVYDDGSGPSLYAGGDFTSVGSNRYNGIARWDGTAWRSIGTLPFNVGVSGSVTSLAVLDSASAGPVLVMGGAFNRFDGGFSLYSLATWDGATFGTLGGGLMPGTRISSMGVIPDAVNGDHLYIAGSFTSVGANGNPVTPADGFARWDGAEWAEAGDGWGHAPPTSMTYVPPGHAVDEGLYVMGDFTSADQIPARYLARYTPENGFEWLGGGLSPLYCRNIRAAELFGPPGDERLYVAGSFTRADTAWCVNLATWDGSAWSRAGNAPSAAGQTPTFSRIAALETWDDGTGPALYAGGAFGGAGTTDALNLARWDGAQWHSVGGEWGSPSPIYVPAPIQHLVAGRVGNEPAEALYVLGLAPSPNRPWTGIERWDGVNRTPLGTGLAGSDELPAPYPRAGVCLDADADGLNELYVGGLFASAGGAPARNVAVWDGATWSAVGAGLDGAVTQLQVFDDGNGPRLYACGSFRFSGKTPVNSVARLGPDGWEALGSGLEDAPSPERALAAAAMTVFDDRSGNGPALYVLGSFLRAGGVDSPFLARWNGSLWEPVDAGIDALWRSNGSPFGLDGALAVFDDGTGHGEELFIAGPIYLPGTDGGYMLVKWNGVPTPLVGQDPLFGSVHTLHATSASDGPSLVVGGSFGSVEGISSPAIARLIPCDPCDLPCDWNADGDIGSPDFFLFLTDFFAGHADYNADGETGSQDFFDFLSCFFGGC